MVYKVVGFKGVEKKNITITTDLPYLIFPNLYLKNSAFLILHCSDDFIHCVDMYIKGEHAFMAYISRDGSKSTDGKKLVTSVKNFNEIDTIVQSNVTLESYTKNSFRGYITTIPKKEFNIKFIQGDTVTKEILRKAEESDEVVCLFGLSSYVANIITSSACCFGGLCAIGFGFYIFYDSYWGNQKKEQKKTLLQLIAKIHYFFYLEITEIKYLSKLIKEEDIVIEELKSYLEEITGEHKKYKKEENEMKKKSKKEKKVLKKKSKKEKKVLKKKSKKNEKNLKKEFEINLKEKYNDDIEGIKKKYNDVIEKIEKNIKKNDKFYHSIFENDHERYDQNNNEYNRCRNVLY